jgi:hypothetical protein
MCRAWSARSPVRFDHMELTVPVDSLTATLRREIDDFYGSIFGWSGFDIDVAGRPCRLLNCGSDQFIQVLESDQPLQAPGSDHLGLLLESRQDVDAALRACEQYAEKDERVSIERRHDLAYPGLTVHTFYLNYLLPISFDVHSQDPS